MKTTAFTIQCARICGLTLTPNGGRQGTPRQLLMFNMNMQVHDLISLVQAI